MVRHGKPSDEIVRSNLKVAVLEKFMDSYQRNVLCGQHNNRNPKSRKRMVINSIRLKSKSIVYCSSK